MSLEYTSSATVDVHGRRRQVSMRMALEREDDGPSFHIVCPLPICEDLEDFFSQQIFNAQHAADTPSFPPAYKLLDLTITPSIESCDDDRLILDVAHVVAEMVTSACRALRGMSRLQSEPAPLDERDDRFVVSVEPETFRWGRHRAEFKLSRGEDMSADTLSIHLNSFTLTMADGTVHEYDEDPATLGLLERLQLEQSAVVRVEILKHGDLRLVGDRFTIDSVPGDEWSVYGTGAFEPRSYSTYSRRGYVNGNLTLAEDGLRVSERSTADYTGWRTVWPPEAAARFAETNRPQ